MSVQGASLSNAGSRILTGEHNLCECHILNNQLRHDFGTLIPHLVASHVETSHDLDSGFRV